MTEVQWQGTHCLGDGALRADYSYRPRGLLEAFLESPVNPILILEIVDVRTGKVVSSQEALGDYAELREVREFFRPKVPWSSREQ